MRKRLWFLLLACTSAVLFSGCFDDCLFLCQDCMIKNMDDCTCTPNPDYGCPAGTVHGKYTYDNYGLTLPCKCNCDVGWRGDLCDQKDSSYFMSFRHGADSSALTEETTYNLDSFFIAVLPPASGIRQIRLVPTKFELKSGPFLLCGWGCDYYVEAILANGDTAASATGTLVLDFAEYTIYRQEMRGTLNTNLYVKQTGDIYYIRDAEFRLY